MCTNNKSNIYGERTIKASGGWADKKCYLCGQYFNNGDDLVLIVPSIEYKREYKSLGLNVVAHRSEIEQLKNQCINEEMFILKLAKHSKPKALKLSTIQIEMINQFEKACRDYSFYKTGNTRSGIKCKHTGTTDVLEYNVRTDKISYENSRKRHMFDSLYENQLVARVFNRMHEIRGDSIRDNFNANEIIKKAVETTNKMMGI